MPIDAPDSEVYVNYTAILPSSGDTILLDPFFIQLSSVEFSYAEGYFANQLHDNGLDTVEIIRLKAKFCPWKVHT